MNAVLLGQSLLSGLLSGGLYALLGLGLSLSWRYLRIINLSQFALIFLAAYLTYQFVGPWKLSAFVAALVLLPAFFVFAALQHLVMIRFKVDEFASVITTFGLTIVVEALIQAIWSADFIRLDVPALRGSMAVGPLLLPQADTLMFACATAVCVAGWAVLRFTYLGKALRAGLENAQIAAVFGVQNQRLSLLVAGASGALAALGGIFVALLFTLSPSQMYTWLGVVLATVILGGLGNPLGILGAGLLVGGSEAVTMAITAPSWAPLVPFTLMIAILLLRPGRA